MADRTVRVRVVAELPGFDAAMRSGAASTVALGDAAVVAGRGVRTLGLDAAEVRAALMSMGAGARGGAAGLTEAEAAALAAQRGTRLARDEALGMTPAFRRIGSEARSGMGAVRSGVESVLGPVQHLGTLLAGGAILMGLHEIVHAGNEYNDAMNKFLEVTRASGGQMEAAGREAQSLGADMKLPSANAAEAADAMVELAKAGLSAQDAIKAARGTIQLSAAARTDVSTAARIEGDIMDQFALRSSEATKVADTLANTSNAASGELMDIYYAMKYVGPVAHSAGISLKDTATAVGLLGKSGIIGETAGTALRSALVNMSKPTKQAQEGLKTLGIQAYDSNGKFKGLQYVITQLGDASEHLSTKQFMAATAMAFGKPAMAGMIALAHQGGTAFEQFGQQVGRVGGAAALAAAESKGLGGAMRGLGKQISSAFLQVYLGVAPSLEKITRSMTQGVSAAIPYIKDGIRVAGDLWDIYGPTVEAKLKSAASGIGRAAQDLATPLKTAITSTAVAAVPLAITSVHSLGQAFGNASAAAQPMLGGLHDMISSASSGAGALGVLAGRLQVGVGALGDMTAVLRPIGELVGGLAHAFAGLPGPIQLSVISMLAMRPFRSQIQGMQQAVVGFGRSAVTAFRGIGPNIRAEMQTANFYGDYVGRLGAASRILERQSPTYAAMATSFRNVSSSIEEAGGRFAGFRAAAGGAAAAIGVGAGRGLMGAARGLWSFLGGPWGVAIGAAMIGLDLLAKKQQEAAAAAAAHQQRISSLTQALQQSAGVMDGSVRAAAVQTLADAKLKDGKTQLIDVMTKAGVSTTTLTNAYLGQGTSVTALQKKLQAAADANKQWITNGKTSMQVYSPQGQVYKDAADALGSLSGEFESAKKKQADMAAAIKGSGAAALDATNPTGRLQDAIKTLGDSAADADTKAQALHTALDLLSGGELDVEAAVAQMNSAILDLNSSWKAGVDHSQGYGKALLQVDGSLNTTSQNGQALWTKLQALNEQTASAAQATYDYARANGSGVAPALQKAEGRMQTAWAAAVKAGQAFGLSASQAQQLANQMGFIPSSLAITMSTPGLSDTQKQLLYVQGLAGHMPKGSIIKVSALTKDALKDIEAVGFKVKTLPGGRQMEITAPTDKAAAALDALIAKKMPGKSVAVSAATTKAISGLQAVQAKVAATKGKSITVSALTGTAQSALKDLGFKVQSLPNHQIKVTLPTGGPAAAAAAIQGYINGLHGKTVTITTNQVTRFYSSGSKDSGGIPVAKRNYAGGGIVRRYADGGSAVQVIPHGGAVVGPGTGTSDSIPALISNGEYVIKAAAVRKYGLHMFDRLNTMRFASGGLAGFTYTPTGQPVLGGPSDAKGRYDADIQALKDAWDKLNSAVKDQKKAADDLSAAEKNLSKVRHEHHTKAQLQAAEDRVAKAKKAKKSADKTVSDDRKKVNDADDKLGLKHGSKAPKAFDLDAYEKELDKSVAATDKWRGNLQKISKRGGADVEALLEGMGQDGYDLVNKLAGASDKQFQDIVNKLKKTGDTAKATLADYSKQLTASTKQNQQFSDDLQKLASEGYGDLAQALAAQGDANAMDIAHQAATGGPLAASTANRQVQAAQNTLTGDDLANSLTLLTVLRGGTGRGYADLIAAGLTPDVIKALVPKMTKQISALPDANKATFIKQWVAQGGQPMALGGILTSATPVLAGEAGVPEAFIPLTRTARSQALLATAAAAMGHRLIPARSYASAAHTAACQGHGDRINNITLNGAKQTAAEQAADIARVINFVG
ncbi:phage tail tape measure protein [Streptomyces griseofuscus]|uniref:Phage tail tape measure protein n=1 Tax=Streptomyces griseofuscus TaxID=146922 RepID=A0A3R8S885_9ACTN|nr:phage tail tape measure protein [Streptomyces griseofuscus]RRQ81568.1 phage tail tape measure protein [Streptomyces griseofuscus]